MLSANRFHILYGKRQAAFSPCKIRFLHNTGPAAASAASVLIKLAARSYAAASTVQKVIKGSGLPISNIPPSSPFSSENPRKKPMIHFTPPPDWHLFGAVTVNIHSLAFCAGAMTAYFWTLKRLPEKLRDHVDNLALLMTLGGILGARLLYAAVNWQNMHSIGQIFAFWEGGLISYGGFIGAIAAWLIYLKINKIPLDVMCHAMAPGALLGWGVGRLGCFFAWNGEIGVYTDVPWAFIVGSDAPRHPVMLYLALAHCTFALLSAFIAEKYRINAAGPALIAFGAARAVLEYWRDYNPAWLYQGSAFMSFIWVVLGIWLLYRLPYPAAESGGQKQEEGSEKPEPPAFQKADNTGKVKD